MNKKYLLLGLLGVILVILTLGRCDRQKKGAINDINLKPQEKTAIIVDTDREEITTINRGNSNRNGVRATLVRRWFSKPSTVSPNVIKQIDGVKDLRISIDNRGNVSYTFRTWGFQFSPEAGICYASSSHTGITLNDNFFFYRKYGALIGFRFALSGGKDIKPYVAYTYNPEWKYINNTSLVIGIDLDKQLVIGTSTHF